MFYSVWLASLFCLVGVYLRLTDPVGTDHPFFPPLGDEEDWPSVTTNYKAINAAFENGDAEGVLGGNAVRILHLK